MMLVFLSTACAPGYNPAYYFNDIQVANLSGAAIQNLNLSVKGSDKTLSCDQVGKNAVCEKHFGKRRYPQQAVELSWTHGDGSEKLQQLNPPIPAYYNSGSPLRMVFEINPDGSVKSSFEQDTFRGF